MESSYVESQRRGPDRTFFDDNLTNESLVLVQKQIDATVGQLAESRLQQESLQSKIERLENENRTLRAQDEENRRKLALYAKIEPFYTSLSEKYDFAHPEEVIGKLEALESQQVALYTAETLSTALSKFKAQRDSCLAWRERAQQLEGLLQERTAVAETKAEEGRRAHEAVRESIVQLNEAATVTQQLRRDLAEAVERAAVLEQQVKDGSEIQEQMRTELMAAEAGRLQLEATFLTNERERRRSELAGLQGHVRKIAAD